MIVGALLDLGASKEKLLKALDSIPAKGYKIEIKKIEKSGIAVTDFNVILDEMHENHDHDNNYLHGKSDIKHHDHYHRNLEDIKEIIDKTAINDNTKNIAKKIFTILAEAESKAHNKKIEEVHFHEVGAIDSIIDIISIAFCIDDLKIKEVIPSILYEGVGTIRCRHGIIPVPAPATLNIIEKYNLVMHQTDTQGELVTPTGASALAALKTKDKLPLKYKVLKIGMGSGKRNYKTSGILRVMIIEEEK